MIIAALSGIAAFANLSPALAEEMAATVIEKGKAVAFDRKKGNCLACHAMDDGALPGNIAPPIVSMKLRYPDKAKLREQIWDASIRNPNTIMPPFGRHQLLSEEEIDNITEYVYTL
ncbi:MAG: sulfur oxidation c-type cytochrome SoxX [Gammaproteobacteria bacterium]|nr:sulfur oxidation c-type cytochrome SoxX [Gammaproteobacteria bacterium]